MKLGNDKGVICEQTSIRVDVDSEQPLFDEKKVNGWVLPKSYESHIPIVTLS
jgi:hypothetical protein